MRECIRVHDNKAVDNPMKPKYIDNWYYHIMKVALRSKASNNWNITWMEYGNTTVPIKESPCPRREDRLPNRPIQIKRIDQTLPILIQSRPFLLTWINVNSCMDKLSHAQYELKLLIHRTNNTNRYILIYPNKILSLLLTWINFNPRMDNLSHA